MASSSSGGYSPATMGRDFFATNLPGTPPNTPMAPSGFPAHMQPPPPQTNFHQPPPDFRTPPPGFAPLPPTASGPGMPIPQQIPAAAGPAMLVPNPMVSPPGLAQSPLAMSLPPQLLMQQLSQQQQSQLSQQLAQQQRAAMPPPGIPQQLQTPPPHAMSGPPPSAPFHSLQPQRSSMLHHPPGFEAVDPDNHIREEDTTASMPPGLSQAVAASPPPPLSSIGVHGGGGAPPSLHSPDGTTSSGCSSTSQAIAIPPRPSRVAALASSLSDADHNDGMMSFSPSKLSTSTIDTFDHEEESGVPLQTAWTFWLDRPVHNASMAEYKASLKKIYTVSTVQGFWSVFHHIPQVWELKLRTYYHLMREEKEPLWEDPSLARGGVWRIKCPKRETSRVWKELLLAAIGEQFCDEVHDGDDICGLSVSPREKDDLIQIWNLRSEDVGHSRVLDKVHHLLPDVRFNAEFYKPHQTHSAFEGARQW